jgi:hypothetical protein
MAGENCIMRHFIICTFTTKMIKSTMKWAGTLACMEDMEKAHTVLERKPEGRRPFGRPWNRWEDNIKINLREIRCESTDQINQYHT